jgi:hypothetical protein
MRRPGPALRLPGTTGSILQHETLAPAVLAYLDNWNAHTDGQRRARAYMPWLSNTLRHDRLSRARFCCRQA